MNETNNLPLVSIGIPVFNGEKYLKKRIDSIIKQTYNNFKIVISDNASTDSTSKICNELVKKDKRIEYVKQEKNIGYVENFNYLIKNAIGEYFIIAGVDDIWEPEFLQKNIEVLNLERNFVGSIGNVKYFGRKENKFKPNTFTKFLKKKIRRDDINILEKHVISVSGEFNQKINKYLRFNQGSFVYGLFRTKEIKKNIISGPLAAWDLAFILNILKFGDLHVIEEDLLHKYAGGISTSGIIETYKRNEIPFYDLIIPNFSFFKWSCTNLGFLFCLKNIDWFILLTIYGEYAILKKLMSSKCRQ